MQHRPSAALLGLSLLVAACGGEQDAAPVVAPDEDEVAAAGADAGCVTTVADGELDGTHLDPAEAPPAAELYPERPAVGGPHLARWLTAGVFDAPVDERAAVHNLEHGAVAVYLDPGLPDDEVEEVVGWAEARNAAGLLDERTGAGLLVAPFDEPLDAPVALRAWGVALDCERFDPVVADAFVREHFGTAGDAPEGSFGTDPTSVVGATTDA